MSSPSLITCELEQLISKKLLAIENMSLLTDFLVKHPSVLLRDTLLSSSRSEFVELLHDVRKCGFDKDWLDGVEKHALFPDLHFSQDALQKLLDSQQHVTKEVEAINLKLNIFSQHVEDLKRQLISSEAVLESIIQQKAQ
ncbi:CC-NBS-LRR resistance protein, partial [Trifolium medium]|nr:CC-NBS-LRR resistance protein [Trifolium medium]